MANDTKTICSLLTPPGRGAVAVIAIRGTAEEILGSNFEPANGKHFATQTRRKIIYGVWKSTGEDLIIYGPRGGSFEIHCHGGNMASRAIVDDLKSAGVEEVPPQIFFKSTDACSPGAVWKSEVLIAISEATTNRTAEILLSQLSIGPGAVDAIASQIGAFEFESALKQIESIRVWSEFGTELTQARSIVFCGQPNVGKSSLVNAIVGFQRAIVNEVAGTTRDVVSQSTAISGWPVELRDTAGLRESDNVIEAIGIEKARSEIATADLKICVFDVQNQWDNADQQLVDSISPDLIVFNKSDLVDESEIKTRCSKIPNSIATSVKSETGIESLIEQIGTRLTPELPSPNQAIPVSQEQCKRLDEAAADLKNCLKHKDQSESEKLNSVSLILDRLGKSDF